MMERSTEELVLVSTGEYWKLHRACQSVWEEMLNTPVGSTHPHVESAIRRMIKVMESSTAPGLIAARKAAKVS